MSDRLSPAERLTLLLVRIAFKHFKCSLCVDSFGVQAAFRPCSHRQGVSIGISQSECFEFKVGYLTAAMNRKINAYCQLTFCALSVYSGRFYLVLFGPARPNGVQNEFCLVNSVNLTPLSVETLPSKASVFVVVSACHRTHSSVELY